MAESVNRGATPLISPHPITNDVLKNIRSLGSQKFDVKDSKGNMVSYRCELKQREGNLSVTPFIPKQMEVAGMQEYEVSTDAEHILAAKEFKAKIISADTEHQLEVELFHKGINHDELVDSIARSKTERGEALFQQIIKHRLQNRDHCGDCDLNHFNLNTEDIISIAQKNMELAVSLAVNIASVTSVTNTSYVSLNEVLMNLLRTNIHQYITFKNILIHHLSGAPLETVVNVFPQVISSISSVLTDINKTQHSETSLIQEKSAELLASVLKNMTQYTPGKARTELALDIPDNISLLERLAYQYGSVSPAYSKATRPTCSYQNVLQHQPALNQLMSTHPMLGVRLYKQLPCIVQKAFLNHHTIALFKNTAELHDTEHQEALDFMIQDIWLRGIKEKKAIELGSLQMKEVDKGLLDLNISPRIACSLYGHSVTSCYVLNYIASQLKVQLSKSIQHIEGTFDETQLKQVIMWAKVFGYSKFIREMSDEKLTQLLHSHHWEDPLPTLRPPGSCTAVNTATKEESKAAILTHLGQDRVKRLGIGGRLSNYPKSIS